ncbi:MAG: hypothetical protein KDA32_13300 [Phycisphaerales bacterium]|nr:hypothetical protein [Phycisphaerales bacterium]
MRLFCTLGLMLALAAPAFAAEDPKPDDRIEMEAVKSAQPLAGARRIRFILQQMDLTDEQIKYAGESMAMLDINQGKPQLDESDLGRIMELVAEAQAAKDKGDDKRYKEIEEEIKNMRPGAKTFDGDFRDMYVGVLSEKETKQFDAILADLKRNPTGELRPIDLVRHARAQNLDAEQQKKLASAIKTCREHVAEESRLKDGDRLAAINRLLGETRSLLNPEQRKAFNAEILRLRRDYDPLRGKVGK